MKADESADYYLHALSAERLRQCYEIAPPRVRRYLEAEIGHVLTRINPGDCVLELGCGYGRVVERLATIARMVVGIDNSWPSLRLAQDSLNDYARFCDSKPNPKRQRGTLPPPLQRGDSGGSGPVACASGSDRRRTIAHNAVEQFRSCHLLAMNASTLAFAAATFDVVVCIQNGISAFKVDPGVLIRECMRVVRPRGTVLLSSYAPSFWPDRLKWFEMQAEAGLVGEIDRERTHDGLIVCKDGFTARTADREEFRALCAPLGIAPVIEEVDGSSLFCEIRVPE